MRTAYRKADYATVTGGFRTDILPWRLYQKGKALAWNPADIDFSSDRRDWDALPDTPRKLIARLATTFMAGEEAVTLDIVPLLRVAGEEGRVEEAMFLTTFIGDEAKHAEFFRLWFDAVGVNEQLGDLLPQSYRRIFDDELPGVMRRLDTDRSPEAVLDAALTYNHFVEGVLAMTGYWAWQRIFTAQDILSGMRAGLELVQRDERRHLAYGTYLCRRIVAEHPRTWEFVTSRMAELEALGMAFVTELGTTIITELQSAVEAGQDSPLIAPDPEKIQAGQSFAEIAGQVLLEFTEYGRTQLQRRMSVIEVARHASVDDVDRGTVEEDVEAELERA